MPNWYRCQIDSFYTLGAKLGPVPNWLLLHPWCQIGSFILLVPNWVRCQIDSFALLVPNWSGAKLTPVPNWLLYTLGAKLVPVPNWYRCQIDSFTLLVPNWPPNTLGAKLSANPNIKSSADSGRRYSCRRISLATCSSKSGCELLSIIIYFIELCWDVYCTKCVKSKNEKFRRERGEGRREEEAAMSGNNLFLFLSHLSL